MAFFIQFCVMNICFNGTILSATTPLLLANNRSFKYGDGLFETMKVFKKILLLSTLHFERLFTSLLLLEIEPAPDFTKEILLEKILKLCSKNNCGDAARIRLAVYRTEDGMTGYLIEATPLSEEVNKWNEAGLSIDLYPYARKSMDAFANIKSANFLPYVLAEKYARENGAEDAIVLNAHNYLCDSSKANIFLIKDGEVITPALHQGCINGVVRRVVIEEVKKMGYHLHQQKVSEADLIAADEVFLTNAIQIIRWVKSYGGIHYSCRQTQQIFNAVKKTIFNELVH
jgi:branched-chain amino acid aminotransferase